MFRRPVIVIFSIVHLVTSGCAPRRVARAPLSLSDYIRTVYKISQENTVEADDEQRKLLEQRPELAALAERARWNPGDVESRNELANAFLQEGNLWSAYNLFNEARNLTDGRSFHAEIGLAQVWDRWRDYTLARRHAAAAIDIHPGSALAYETLGRIHLHAGAPADAIVAFRAALQIEPDAPVVLANLGYAYLEYGSWNQARASFEKALALNPGLTEARNNLGVVLARMGHSEEALEHFQSAGGESAGWNNLGAVYLAQDKPAEAIVAFEEAIERNPGYEKAQENLAAARALLPPPVVVDLPPMEEVGEFGDRDQFPALEVPVKPDGSFKRRELVSVPKFAEIRNRGRGSQQPPAATPLNPSPTIIWSYAQAGAIGMGLITLLVARSLGRRPSQKESTRYPQTMFSIARNRAPLG